LLDGACGEPDAGPTRTSGSGGRHEETGREHSRNRASCRPHQGDFLYVPPGGIHGFRNEVDEPASIRMLFAPGAPREAYFEGFGALADMTDDERREWFIRHDNYWIQ
jgi:uncharacterized RmlC-like cupin family protein